MSQQKEVGELLQSETVALILGHLLGSSLLRGLASVIEPTRRVDLVIWAGFLIAAGGSSTYFSIMPYYCRLLIGFRWTVDGWVQSGGVCGSWRYPSTMVMYNSDPIVNIGIPPSRPSSRFVWHSRAVKIH